MHRREFAEFEEPKRHFFSLRHRCAMKKLLSPKQPSRSGLRYLPPPKRIAVIILLIFLAILTATACTVIITDIMNKVPDKWMTEPADRPKYYLASVGGGMPYSLKVVGEFMNDELGIDPNDRTFTHEITDEQREWLASRHDIETLKNDASINSSEFQNFLADLYYLGIFSKSEISDYCASDFDFLNLTGQTAILIRVGEIDEDVIFPDRNCAALEYVTKVLKRQGNELYYMETDPAMQQNVQNCPTLLQNMQEILNDKQEMHDVLLDFFSSFE